MSNPGLLTKRVKHVSADVENKKHIRDRNGYYTFIPIDVIVTFSYGNYECDVYYTNKNSYRNNRFSIVTSKCSPVVQDLLRLDPGEAYGKYNAEAEEYQYSDEVRRIGMTIPNRHVMDTLSLGIQTEELDLAKLGLGHLEEEDY